MKTKYLLFFSLLIIGLLYIVGCAAVQAPPSQQELKYYSIETNYVPQITTYSNLDGSVEIVSNNVPIYTFTPNTNAKAVAEIGGAVGNIWGVGGVVSTLIASLFAIYAKRRSNQAITKANTAEYTAAELTQIIESGREIMKTLPNGPQYEAAWKTWMINHQKEAGIIGAVADIIATQVDNEKAKGAAQTILDLIKKETTNSST